MSELILDHLVCTDVYGDELTWVDRSNGQATLYYLVSPRGFRQIAETAGHGKNAAEKAAGWILRTGFANSVIQPNYYPKQRPGTKPPVFIDLSRIEAIHVYAERATDDRYRVRQSLSSPGQPPIGQVMVEVIETMKDYYEFCCQEIGAKNLAS